VADTYRLVGGPCDGTTRTLVNPATPGQVIVCQGYYYEFGSDGLFHLAALPSGGGGAQQAQAPDARQVSRAWHKLTNVLAVESAHAIRQSRAGRARMRRVVR
jgi:hypothetical protein